MSAINNLLLGSVGFVRRVLTRCRIHWSTMHENFCRGVHEAFDVEYDQKSTTYDNFSFPSHTIANNCFIFTKDSMASLGCLAALTACIDNKRISCIMHGGHTQPATKAPNRRFCYRRSPTTAYGFVICISRYPDRTTISTSSTNPTCSIKFFTKPMI